MPESRSTLDIPIFHRIIYDLHKLFHSYHPHIRKAQRYTLWQKCESTTLAFLEAFIETSHDSGEKWLQSLDLLSNKLDLLKILVRVAKETRTIENPQSLRIPALLQEIDRMVGGRIKSVPY